jgi:outer membrane protein TolC
MILKNFCLKLFFWVAILQPLVFPAISGAQEPAEIFTLEKTIDSALKVNLGLKSSKEETAAAVAAKKAQRTQFFPTFSASYEYDRLDASSSVGGIEQTKNYRINREGYKEQVATQTDVLIAQTLLTRTMTNYYNALYAFKISKATLYRAMGQEVVE